MLSLPHAVFQDVSLSLAFEEIKIYCAISGKEVKSCQIAWTLRLLVADIFAHT